jgi:hypothetical protein
MNKLLLALPFALPTLALAAADCPEYPDSDWMSVFDLQKMIVNEYGFAIKKFKIDGDCYEIYGWERGDDGEERRIEVYFDAKTGAIVKKKDD